MTKICIFAPNEEEANKWARSQNLDKNQYFYPHDVNDVLFKKNFHVIVVGIGNISSFAFEKMYNLALEKGKVGRI